MQRKILQAVMIFLAAAYFISGCTTAPQKPAKLAAGNYDYVKEYIDGENGLAIWGYRMKKQPE